MATAMMINSSIARQAARPTFQQARRASLTGLRRSLVVVRAEVKEDIDQSMVTPNTDRSKIGNIEAGNISNENAERRADMSGKPNFAEANAFDGPGPETINGRLAMIGVTSCLAAEFVRGIGLKEQVGEAPAPILAVFVLISLASYVPIFRGYTRKEEFSNGPFTPKSENWNGRLAMVGFAGILVTEALSGMTIPETYGLPHGTITGPAVGALNTMLGFLHM
ncbi:hypothetical protein WJX81_005342 [Elliptochloris bilobata]|uniref:Uncharacterized protein n=1 Tax=Elliptochloris bilobata TaxID=381761 RepID=A0AAW1SAE0_9CHLO